MYNDIQKMMQEEQKRLKACKTKADLNSLYKGRLMQVQDRSEWHGENCEFVEMIGEGKREKWKMKIKTRFGTFLEMKASDVMVIMQQIKTTEKESNVILKHLQSKGFSTGDGKQK